MKRVEMDLGLELAMRHARRGAGMPYEDIANFMGCSWQAVRFIERRALMKLRKKAAVQTWQKEAK